MKAYLDVPNTLFIQIVLWVIWAGDVDRWIGLIQVQYTTTALSENSDHIDYEI